MEKTRLQNISETIWQRIEKKKRIQEEQAYIYFDGIVDVLCGGERVTVSCEENNLSNSLSEIWSYRNLDEFSKENVFLLGSIWGAMKVEERKRERREEASDLERLIRKYHNYFWLLRAMEQEPGINHRDLAGRGKKKPSELSQLIARLEPDGLFTHNRIGREKYYYIQERGRKVCKAIAGENSEKIQKRGTWPDFFVNSVFVNSKNAWFGNEFLSAEQFIANKVVDRKEYKPVYAVNKEICNDIKVSCLDENRSSSVRDLFNETVMKRSREAHRRGLADMGGGVNPNVNWGHYIACFVSRSVSCEENVPILN